MYDHIKGSPQSKNKVKTAVRKGPIEEVWNQMDSARTTIKRFWEKFASWTLPYLFPSASGTDMKDEILYPSGDNIGADAVNHLSNHVVDTLFTPWRPFFRIYLTDELLAQLKEQKMEPTQIDEVCSRKEREAVQLNNRKGFRAEAPIAAQLLIVLGNCMMYYPEGDEACQVYNPADYIVKRDLNGQVVLILTRDIKAFGTFSKEVRKQLEEANRDLKPTDNLCVYTKIELQDNGKFKVEQEAHGVKLKIGDNFYPRATLPWIPLTWKLKRGEDWGRGVVEDKAKAFHTLAVLTEAEAQLAANCAELKFLVKPSSYVDVDELQNSPSGSYHVGEENDVVPVQMNKFADMQAIAAIIERYRREIQSTFLMAEAVQRDAERVTAQEIRYMAQKLESKHSGVYARLSRDWQTPISFILLASINFNVGSMKQIRPEIITGMESLSRSTEMDNIAAVFQDVQQAERLPEQALNVISFTRLMQKAANNRGVNAHDFVKTPDEIQQEQQALMAQQAQLQSQQATAQIAVKAADQMTKEQ